MITAAVTNSQRVQRFPSTAQGHAGGNPVPAPVVETPASKFHDVQSAAFAIRSRVL